MRKFINHGRLLMDIRLKYWVPIVVPCVGLALSLLFLWSTSNGSFEEKHQLKIVQQESKLFRVAAEEFSEKMATQLMQTLEAEMASPTPTETFEKSSYQAIALLLSAEGENSVLDWHRTNEVGINKTFFETIANKIQAEKLAPDQIIWKRIEGLDRKPHLLLGVQLRVKTNDSERVRLAIGILPMDAMMSLMSPYQGEAAEVFIVDSSGFSLSTSDTRYLGTQMDIHPIVSALKKQDKIDDIFRTRSLSNQATVGGFQRTKNSNMYVVLNRPIESEAGTQWSLVLSSILAIFGFLILGVGINYFFFRSRARESANEMDEHLMTTAVSEGLSKMERARLEKNVLDRTLRAMSGGLRSSIYSLIGKCHILMPKLNEPSLIDDVKFMESELRVVRNLIEEMGPGTHTASNKPLPILDLSEAVRHAIVASSGMIQTRGIQFRESLMPEVMIRVPREDLEHAVTTLLQFCINIFDGQKDGILEIKTLVIGSTIRLEILVPGVDMQNRIKSNPEYILSRLMLLGFGGQVSVVTNAHNEVLRIDMPRAQSIEPRLMIPEKPDPRLEEIDEDADVDGDTGEIDELEISSTREIEPEEVDPEITGPIKIDKIENTMEVKVRRPKVRLDL
jgi:hypothetical protein